MTREEKLNYVANMVNEQLNKITYEQAPLYQNYHIPTDKTQTLYAAGWRFQWSRGKKVIGQCCYSTKTIQISHIYTENVEHPEMLRNTVLHEIAHALTPGQHHNEVWKLACRAVGADPSRLCHESDVVKANKNLPGWRAICSGCNRTHKMLRRPKYIYSMYCASTPTCKVRKPALIWEKTNGS